MRFKQSKIRYGSKTTPVSHPNFPTLPQTRLTSVYHNFLLWNTTATTDHISATEYQSEDPTTENTQLNNRMTTANKKKVMVIRMSFRQAHTAQTGFSTGFAKFTWHKQGSAPDIRLLRDHYEIPFVNQNNCFTYDWILSCNVGNFKSGIMLRAGRWFESRQGQDFSLIQIVQTVSGAHSASYATGTAVLSFGLKRQGLILIIHLRTSTEVNE